MFFVHLSCHFHVLKHRKMYIIHGKKNVLCKIENLKEKKHTLRFCLCNYYYYYYNYLVKASFGKLILSKLLFYDLHEHCCV